MFHLHYYYLYLFTHQMMFVWLNNNTNGLSFGVGILGFSGFRVARLLVLATIFYSLYFWPLCCPSFFDLQLRHLITPSHWYLMITPLISSDYHIDIFWLPHWYLMITPLISSDYPIGILWLPHWYLMITPLVSSDYLIGILWLPH